MPRTTKQQAFEAEVREVLANLPFSPQHAADSPYLYENLLPKPKTYGFPTDAEKTGIRYAVAKAVYEAYRLQGKSATECRAQFAGTVDAIDGHGGNSMRGLSGPRRRFVFREYGGDFSNAIAPSYKVFGDGDPRAGSAHAREHGPLAIERRAAEQAAFDAEQAKQFDADERKALRLAIAEHGGNAGKVRSLPKLRALLAELAPAEQAEQSSAQDAA